MNIVPTSGFYDTAGRSMASLRDRAEQLQGQIATGERLSRSSDDPVAAQRLRLLARAGALSDAGTANGNRAMGDLGLADSALSEMADSIHRARELATQAANETLNPTQRAAIGTEISAIRDTIIALANSTDSAGHPLFGGQGTGPAYTLDGTGNAVYAGTPTSGEVPLGDGQSVIRGVTGPEIFDFSHGGAPTDLLAVLNTLSLALAGGSPDPAAAARDGIDALGSGLEKLTNTQTVIGARMNWVDLNMERHARQSEFRAEEQADVGGTDIATTITELQQIMTVLEASQASFARLSSLSLFDMIR